MDISEINGLEECIGRAIQEHLAKTNVELSRLAGLNRPILRIEAFLEEAGDDVVPSRSKRIASVRRSSICISTLHSFVAPRISGWND
jgi:ATP-dependent RNA helicase DDX49/DBP8